MHVELNRLYSRPRSHIGDADAHLHISALRRFIGSNAQVAVLEGGIAQPIAKRVQRRSRHIGVAAIMVALLDPILFGRHVVVVRR